MGLVVNLLGRSVCWRNCWVTPFPTTTYLDNSVTVSFNELVQAKLSCYKSEPLLELKGKPLEWWKYHEHSYPKLSHMAYRSGSNLCPV